MVINVIAISPNSNIVNDVIHATVITIIQTFTLLVSTTTIIHITITVHAGIVTMVTAANAYMVCPMHQAVLKRRIYTDSFIPHTISMK